MSFRRPENYKRYEDIFFYPKEKIETRMANNTYLNKEYSGLDWYRSRILMSFKLTKLTGNNVNVNDNNRIVNGAHSFIKNISFSINGREVYDCTNANHCMNIKNLISYSPSYAETAATNELFFLDTSTSANRNKYLTRQVQHGRNNANTGWTPRVFIENEDPSFNKGSLLEKNYLEVQLLFFVKYLSIEIQYSKHVKTGFYQIPNLNCKSKLKVMIILFGEPGIVFVEL